MKVSVNFSVKSLVFLLIFLLASLKSLAYPEMIRHGYVNCQACHTTMQGGDLLSAYGRELSKELLSRNDNIFKTSTTEKTYWQIDTPEWFSVGADLRLLQSFSESSQASKGQFLVMQVDVDALAKISPEFQVYTSIGRFEPSKSDAEWRDFIYTPRVWAQYTHNWREGAEAFSLRAGRFFPSYGINIPEHSYVTRRYLQFNPGQERVSLEASWNNEDYQIVATGLWERANFDQYDQERGYVVQLSKVFTKSTRIGANIYRSQLTQQGSQSDKAFEGLYALIGWTSEWTTLFQVDRIYNPNGKDGILDLLKLSYEYAQGIELFATQEYYNADTEKTDPHVEAYGVGVQYFPVPNFDVFASFRKQKDSSVLAEYQSAVWLVGHLYF